jgi:hypothetical protein
MKNIQLNLIRSAWVCLLAFVVVGFGSAEEECLRVFKLAFEKMKQITPPEGKGLAIKYSVDAQTADGKVYHDVIEMTSMNKKALVKSQDATIYQDEKTMVIIRPAEHSIFVTTPLDANIRKFKMQDMMKLQDSIFANLKLKKCSDDETASGSDKKKLDFLVPPAITSRSGIKSATYWLDIKNTTINKVALYYNGKSTKGFTSLIYDFAFINNQYTESPFDGSAIGIVMNGKKQLKSSYKGYSIIDNRR